MTPYGLRSPILRRAKEATVWDPKPGKDDDNWAWLWFIVLAAIAGASVYGFHVLGAGW